jgi:hypothetical protein
MLLSFLYPLLLTLHIAGFTLFAGITLADFAAFRRFWKVWDRDPAEAVLTRQITAAFPPLIRLGAIVLILAGFGMMVLVHGVFGHQTWFRIKMGLVLLIIVNGVLGGRLQGIQLKRLLDGVASTATVSPALLRGRIRLFHIVQLLLLLGIFMLCAFRFN